MDSKVSSALDMVKLHNNHNPVRTSSKDTETEDVNILHVVDCVRDIVDPPMQILQNTGDALAEEHRNTLKHGSLEIPMVEILVVATAVQVYWAELVSWQ